MHKTMENIQKVDGQRDNASCVGFFAPRTNSAKKYWNKFCWFCHKEGSAIKKFCTKCSHVYHIDCFGIGTICRHCATNKIHSDSINGDGIRMLKLLIDKIFSDSDFVIFDSHHARKPLSEMSAKIADYRNFACFLDDIKWTVHKCFVVYGECKLSTTAERLLIFCVDQVESMQACVECYINSCERPDHHMVMVCTAAHPVVWSRMCPDSHYWPAKLLIAQNPKVTVRFFGHHSKADIALTDCLMYSRDYPNEADAGSLPVNHLDAALEEANVYIENLQQTIGTFAYASANTPFNPTNSPNPNEIPIARVTASKNQSRSDDGRKTKYSSIMEQPSQIMNWSKSIPSTSQAVQSNQCTFMNVQIKQDPSAHFNSFGTKRNATKSIASSEPKARKSFPTPINLEIVSGFLKLNPKCLIHKNDHLDGKLMELETVKKRLEQEINNQQLENQQLKATNQRLAAKMSSINAKWDAKLKATERKIACITCGNVRNSPFYCSKTCQIEYWKKQTHQQDD